MELIDKIKQLKINLTDDDFSPIVGTIILQDNSDGNGAFIKSWNHPTETQPTQEELDGIN